MFNSKSQVIFLYLVLGVVVMALYTNDPSWQGRLDGLRDSVILTWTTSLMNLLLFGSQILL